MKLNNLVDSNRHKTKIRRQINNYLDEKYRYSIKSISWYGDTEYFLIDLIDGNPKPFNIKIDKYASENNYTIFDYKKNESSKQLLLLGKNSSRIIQKYKYCLEREADFIIEDGSFAETLRDRLLDIKDDYDITVLFSTKLHFMNVDRDPHFLLSLSFEQRLDREIIQNEIERIVILLAESFNFKFTVKKHFLNSLVSVKLTPV